MNKTKSAKNTTSDECQFDGFIDLRQVMTLQFKIYTDDKSKYCLLYGWKKEETNRYKTQENVNQRWSRQNEWGSNIWIR